MSTVFRTDDFASNFVVDAAQTDERALDADVRAQIDAATAAFDVHHARAEAAEAEAAQLQARIDAAEAETARLRKSADEAQGRVDAMIAHENARTEARFAVLDGARRILGSGFVSTGKTDREIQVAAISKANPNFVSDGRSDGYVAGVFAAIVGGVSDADARRIRNREDAAR